MSTPAPHVVPLFATPFGVVSLPEALFEGRIERGARGEAARGQCSHGCARRATKAGFGRGAAEIC